MHRDKQLKHDEDIYAFVIEVLTIEDTHNPERERDEIYSVRSAYFSYGYYDDEDEFNEFLDLTSDADNIDPADFRDDSFQPCNLMQAMKIAFRLAAMCSSVSEPEVQVTPTLSFDD